MCRQRHVQRVDRGDMGLQADAEDLDGRPCVELLSQLLSGPGVGGLRALALGRCLNTALSLQPIASDLFMQAPGDAGGPAGPIPHALCCLSCCRAAALFGESCAPWLQLFRIGGLVARQVCPRCLAMHCCSRPVRTELEVP